MVLERERRGEKKYRGNIQSFPLHVAILNMGRKSKCCQRLDAPKIILVHKEDVYMAKQLCTSSAAAKQSQLLTGVGRWKVS